jgi:hypothetical protein
VAANSQPRRHHADDLPSGRSGSRRLGPHTVWSGSSGGRCVDSFSTPATLPPRRRWGCSSSGAAGRGQARRCSKARRGRVGAAGRRRGARFSSPRVGTDGVRASATRSSRRTCRPMTCRRRRAWSRPEHNLVLVGALARACPLAPITAWQSTLDEAVASVRDRPPAAEPSASLEGKHHPASMRSRRDGSCGRASCRRTTRGATTAKLNLVRGAVRGQVRSRRRPRARPRATRRRGSGRLGVAAKTRLVRPAPDDG